MASGAEEGLPNRGFEHSADDCEGRLCTSLDERNPHLSVLNPSLKALSKQAFFSKKRHRTENDCNVQNPSPTSSEASSSDSFTQDSHLPQTTQPLRTTDGRNSNTVGAGCSFPAGLPLGPFGSSGIRTDPTRECLQFSKGTHLPDRSGLSQNKSQISGRNNYMRRMNSIHDDQDNGNVNGFGSAEPNTDQEQDYTHTARNETNHNGSVDHRHNREESGVNSDHGSVEIPSQTQGQNMPGRSNSGHTRERNASPKKCPNSCVPVLILSIMILGGGILTLIFLWPRAEISKLFSTEATVLMRVDDVFEDNMADSSSAIFVHYGKKFCFHVKEAVKNEINIHTCWIERLQKGSIRVESRLLIETKKNYTGNDLELLFKKGGTQNGRHTLLGSMEIYTDSIKVDIIETRISSEDTDSPSSPLEFDCARNDQHYLPHEYTWPEHCGEYQLCKDGKGITHVCDTGHEYGYTKDSIQSPCHRPSNRTYCGRKRPKDLAVTTPATTLGSSTEESTGTTIGTTIGTTTTLATIDCSAIDQRIWGLGLYSWVSSAKDWRPTSYHHATAPVAMPCHRKLR
ncbi:uncharacterized protein [Littorina saxatilis]|uniref:uncharacterized protein isoform X2 n=1 Tax=Littorina saxatilis TaxID=31220 RepID=UPI0038B5EA6F